MGSNWNSIDNNFPTFLGDESLKDQVRLLHDFLPILIESLKYQLNNLDSSNWNTTAKKQFQSDTTRELENAMDSTDMEVAELIRLTEDLQNQTARVLRRLADLEMDADWHEKAMEELEQEQKIIREMAEDSAGTLDGLRRFLTVNEDGSLTIGGDGIVIHLAGTVDLNGSGLN